MRKHHALAALLVSFSLALSACGTDGANTDIPVKVSATEHNDADVAFASDMIQHHAQALAIIDLSIGRELEPQITTLAENIRAAQGPEIETMVDWLTDWDEPIPETVRDHANASDGDAESEGGGKMNHGGMNGGGTPETTSAQDMEELENASDAQFGDMWLQMMIEHHTGAIKTAQTETSEGQYAPAVDLASDIIESQSDEIDLMQTLLP